MGISYMTSEVKLRNQNTAGTVKLSSVAESGVQLETSRFKTEGVFGIESLWKVQIRSIWGQILSGGKDYVEVANLAEHIRADYHGRFLIELIQNAEDPSRQTGYPSSAQRFTRLIIVRTNAAVAVLNQGSPFSENDIEAITSLGLSTKNPEISLGNKGVGFKAVFQVTDRPEIYSKPKTGGDLWSKNANRFCMQEKPFSDAAFVNTFKKIVEEEMTCDSGRAEELRRLAGSENECDYLIKELQRAAPFKFPKPLSLEDQEQRVEELGLSREIVKKMSTMVVLPLLDLSETAKIVDEALDELIQSDHSGSTLLFLTGISRIWIFDRKKGYEVLLMRHERNETLLNHTIEFREVTTTERINSLNSCKKRMARWWRVNRRFGRDGSDKTNSNEEASRIKQAVESLRIGTWKDVRSAYVGVALPRSPFLGEKLKPLSADGMFCIGLPTHACTGMPVWVNGPFHSHIARTSIDFKDQEYNRIILEEGIKIFWSALEYIKTLPTADDRRHVLLELELDDGPFRDGIENDRKLPSETIVLDAEKSNYWSPSELKIPAKDDIAAFDQFFSNLENLELHRFCLPDSILLRNCWELLNSLADSVKIEVDNSVYLHRPEGSKSLLEKAASLHRNDEHEWWREFLEWVTESFDYSDLEDQRILPVRKHELAAATDRVFFRPLISVASEEQSLQQDDTEDDESPEEIIDDLDDAFLNDLAFLDEQCVQVRKQAGRRVLTDLARKLSPEQGKVLVRNPRRPEIINEVLAPYLSEICVNQKERVKALSVLAKIADWLHDMKQGVRDTIDFSKVRVPVAGKDENWDWVAPIGVYFGNGWLGHEIDELIEKAYSRGDSRRLPSLSSFRSVTGNDISSEIWRRRFANVGVLDAPRLISTNTGRWIYLKANSNYRLSVENLHECPIPKALNYWSQYLHELAKRDTWVGSGQPYYVRDPVWIDGLERKNGREAVMRLILWNAESYNASLQISVEREKGDNSRNMLSLWVYAVVRKQWRIIPTNLGPCRPSKAWRLDEEKQRTLFAREGLLAYVKPPFDNAVNILKTVGVYSPKDAPVSRIVAELQDVAEALNDLLEKSRRATEAFIRELYIWLQESSDRSDDPDNALMKIKERPVPLLNDGDFTAVDLSSDVIVLLNDDSERLPYVKNSETAYVLPLHARQSNKALYKALRKVFGPNRVMRASEAEIDLEFDQKEQDAHLLDYLVQGLQSSRPNIQRELAALIAYGGKSPMDPNKETFREKWLQFQNTLVRRGHFRNRDPANPVFDQGAEGGAALYVPSSFKFIQILEVCWHLLGPSHRHTWENYVTRLKHGECERFFDGFSLHDRDWSELEIAIGISQKTRIKQLQPALLALYRSQVSDLGVVQFQSKLDSLDIDLEKIAAWIRIEKVVLERALDNSSLNFDDERQLDMVEALGVSISGWQRARRDLGKDPVVFSSTVESFKEWRENIVACLRTVFAHGETDVDLLDELKVMLKKFSEASCTNLIAEQKIHHANVAGIVVGELQPLVDLQTKAGKGLVQRLRTIESKRIVDDLSGSRTPRREITLYKNQSKKQRESDAKEAVSDVMRVACALSKLCGDTIDEKQVWSNSTITPWLQGYWANCFAALRALRKILRTSAPDVFNKLNEFGVFAPQQRVPWRELWKKFPELGELPSTNRPTPQEKIEILGHKIIEDKFDGILSHGSSGTIGQAIVDAVNDQIDMASLATRDRELVTGSKGGRRGRGRNIGRNADSHAGLLGEAFVYESCCKTLPDFDVACWVSDSRTKYGFERNGDDGLGYDFEYSDVEGKLTGMTNKPHCLIEVKSTTSEKNEPFPMTANEWAVAEQCYRGLRREQYVIVRVLRVKSAPVIADVIVNPVHQWRERKLALENRDYIVRT